MHCHSRMSVMSQTGCAWPNAHGVQDKHSRCMNKQAASLSTHLKTAGSRRAAGEAQISLVVEHRPSMFDAQQSTHRTRTQQAHRVRDGIREALV